MINKIKSKLPFGIRKIIRSLYPFNKSLPYTYFSPSFSQFNVSDFFLFRCDNFESIFIAENNLAIIIAEPIECKHLFYFFNVAGTKCGIFEVNSSLFHYQLSINSQMTGCENIGSFIHQTIYSDEYLKKEPAIVSKKLIFQHRGYAGYRKRNDNFGNYSFAHGNFGAMYYYKEKLLSLSIQRSEHYYTPQIIIKNGKFYEIYFNNPTRKLLKISISLKDKSNESIDIKTIYINPLGSYMFEYSSTSTDQIYNISWKTNLPIGRAVVFENDGVLFDIFHS